MPEKEKSGNGLTVNIKPFGPTREHVKINPQITKHINLIGIRVRTQEDPAKSILPAAARPFKKTAL